jgi:hypothetical protein
MLGSRARSAAYFAATAAGTSELLVWVDEGTEDGSCVGVTLEDVGAFALTDRGAKSCGSLTSRFSPENILAAPRLAARMMQIQTRYI